MTFNAKDCSPLEPQPTGADTDWLRRLALAASVGSNVVSVRGDRDEDEPVVQCAPDGTWFAGRYIGSLVFERRRLTVRPRFGLSVIRSWLLQATNVSLVDTPGQLREGDEFIVQLLAVVWARAFVEAARHGLPGLKRDVPFKGGVLRGRLDVAASARLLAAGAAQVVSVRRERSVDHAASRAIVAAYAALHRWLGRNDAFWLPERAKDLLPHLIAVTGPRPKVPSKAELAEVRYTPITAGFAKVAELSRRIARNRGLVSDSAFEGECRGVLLDVAELWELYVLAVTRRAAPELSIKHGTSEQAAPGSLLVSEQDGATLGALRPDVLIEDRGHVVSIVDAKYKDLHPNAFRPSVPAREDLYQLTAYLTRFAKGSAQTWGLLAYPSDPASPDVPLAERRSPWRLDDRTRVSFLTLPHSLEEAALKLRPFLSRGARTLSSSAA